MRRLAPPILLWLMFGATLAWITSRIADWFVMTDELLYERLALSIARLHSPVPRVHDVVIPNLGQLYPLVLSPIFASGSAADGVQRAHVLNAFAMTSAAIPAYLLALRVTRSVCISSRRSTDRRRAVDGPRVVSPRAPLPTPLALLAFHTTITAPSRRHDTLAAVALVAAVAARTQFIVLALVLALLAGRRWREHRVLIGVYAAGAVLALAMTVAGNNPLGTYGTTASGNPLPAAVIPSFFSHLAALGVGLGLVPFIVGGAWLLRRDDPWRADRATTGLYDDGWTRPGAAAHIYVYPYPGQDRSVRRSVIVPAFAPAGVAARPFTVGGSRAVAGDNEVSVETSVCVPPHGAGRLEASADDASTIYGDPTTELTASDPRRGGVQISRIYLSGQVGADC